MVTAVAMAYLYSMFCFTTLASFLGPVGRQGELPIELPAVLGGTANGHVPSGLSLSPVLSDVVAEAPPIDAAPTDRPAADPPVQRPPKRRPAGTGTGRCRRVSSELRCAIGMALVLGAALALNFGLTDGETDETAVIAPEDSYHMPSFASLPEGEWTEMRPGGQTVCSRGTPFVFFVRRGASRKV